MSISVSVDVLIYTSYQTVHHLLQSRGKRCNQMIHYFQFKIQFNDFYNSPSKCPEFQCVNNKHNLMINHDMVY